ncbi:TetR/AcrR family transcriptional regulator [Dyadobacter psychrotolerans]|uniref:TetR/AcrR family transcriptional regulator n=1 Tax=Dyadobacter psychrotolerans TaxID=2541721 RepID=A0A4R5D5G4_9BACT|nr:TetR/AcrR family transcriptional regulator [Dyadobacter psychrotolerans]
MVEKKLKSKDEILRERILSGADRLFQKYGLSKTTVEDIAREAGKGKSTLYYYFKSKEEIFDVIIQNEKKLFFEILQESVSKAPTAKEKLHVFIITRFTRLKELTNLYNVMIDEVKEALDGCVTLRYRKQYEQKEANIVKSIFQYGIVTGEFRVFSDEDLDLMAFCFMSSQHGLEIDMIIHNKLDEMLSRLNFLMSLLIDGIKK